MFNPETETWYVIVTCEKCKSTVVLFRDLTEGKSALNANYIVTCGGCGHKAAYLAEHYYHSAEQANKNALATV
jgi:hypothetical protein